jgi:hypothetical protein
MQNARVSSAKKTAAAKKPTGSSKSPSPRASSKTAAKAAKPSTSKPAPKKATAAKATSPKATPEKTAPKKAATSSAKASTVKKPEAPKVTATPKKLGPRADFGAPIDAFFGKQPEALKPLLVELRRLVEEAAPEATSSLKWGMPCYSIGDTMMCLLGGHKAHVNLVLSGPPGTYADPRGLLSGDGKTGRHLKITSLAEMPVADVKRWLRAAAEHARGN